MVPGFLIPLTLFASLVVAPLSAQGPRADAADRHKSGHSKLGEAFDEGPRERPTKIDGIGRTTFRSPRRSPKCRSGSIRGTRCSTRSGSSRPSARSAGRSSSTLTRRCPTGASRARPAAIGRERSCARHRAGRHAAPRASATTSRRGRCNTKTGRNGDARKDFHRALERLIIKYPDDVEAKALYAYEAMAENRVGTELLIRQVLAVDPNHPGAHHYRIHNWDDQDGAQALESCRRSGTLVPGIGHALHMPGHIYAGLGMYHEAAISLDAATRAEIGYMARRMVFPYNTWNYAHNRNYLSYVQEQLGLPSEAIRGARELLAVPLDPKLNDATRFSPHWQGVAALARALIKFERWDEILAAGRSRGARRCAIVWAAAMPRRSRRSRRRIRPRTSRVGGLRRLKKDIEKPENASYKLQFEVQLLELQGTYALKSGDAIKGLMQLTEAAPKELALRAEYDDPPFFPTLMYSKLGYAYLSQNSPKLAADAFERALETVQERSVRARRTGTRPAGARRHEGGDAGTRTRAPRLERRRARVALARRGARDGHPATALDVSPGPQRNYRDMGLDKFGPAIWQPFAAPPLDARNSTGARVTLDQFKGRNVILVFYLGMGCAHCVARSRSSRNARTSGRGSTRTSWR